MKKLLTLTLSIIYTTLLISCDNDDKSDPILSWSNPDDIKSGSALGDTQLNATSDIAGDFIYTPESGTILSEGNEQVLTVDFIPTETGKYNTISKSVLINVISNGTSSAVFNPDLTYGTITDVDGNSYQTIMVGGQIWMVENLRTTKFQNGDLIPEITDNQEWITQSSAAYASYENQSDLDELATHGLLYNWFAVADSRNIAPLGWHVATEADWIALANEFGGLSTAGGKLKESGSTHWNSPNTDATNASGFTGLPSGRREYTDGSSINAGYNAFWWTSSAYNPDYSWYFQLNYDTGDLIQANFHKQYGFAVRCVKD
jgi:uncharacterized protein (TIGR02145 family)